MGDVRDPRWGPVNSAQDDEYAAQQVKAREEYDAFYELLDAKRELECRLQKGAVEAWAEGFITREHWFGNLHFFRLGPDFLEGDDYDGDPMGRNNIFGESAIDQDHRLVMNRYGW